MTADESPDRDRLAAPGFAAGQSVDLWVAMPEGSRRFQAQLERHDRADGRLTVAWPMARLRFLPVQAGQVVRVEVARAGDALYTAEAEVLEAATEQRPRLTLQPTAAWQRVQRRRDVRLPVSIRASRAERLGQAGERSPILATILDISVGGVLVRSEQALQVGDQLELTFSLTGGGAPLRLRAETLGVRRPDVGRARWEASCQFRETPLPARERIAQFIRGQGEPLGSPAR